MIRGVASGRREGEAHDAGISQVYAIGRRVSSVDWWVVPTFYLSLSTGEKLRSFRVPRLENERQDLKMAIGRACDLYHIWYGVKGSLTCAREIV